MKNMKRKTRYHAETRELDAKPGRYAVLRQWVDGGAISCDDNKGEGFDLEEATALVSQHLQLRRPEK